jgi:(1->4)-alpha-D-glucan 1-alpha-D-glucosylmutase
MSPEPDALHRLARHAGIETRFTDAFGQDRDVPDAVIRALATALGYPAGDLAEIDASLARLQDAPWRVLAPPVFVARDGAETRPVPVHLAAGAQTLDWTLHLENGERQAGTIDGTRMPVEGSRAIDGAMIEERLLALPPLPDGYHRLHVRAGAKTAETALIAAPATCHPPPAGDHRLWGLSTQLYSLRSPRNWGIGDFTDLGDLAEALAGHGADAVGINPLHALFVVEPAKASPYSPSSRRFLNILHLDVEAVPDFAESAEVRARAGATEFRVRLDALRAAPLIDHEGIAAAKLEILDLLYQSFRRYHLDRDTARAQAFARFRVEGGDELAQFALHEALAEHFSAGIPHLVPWFAWPAPWRDPDSAEVRDFAAQSAERMTFHVYLQWLAELQLAEAARRCRAAGLRVGLYGDLALGVDSAGGEAWADQGLYAAGASVGAPPDQFNQMGQAWGLPPLRPDALHARAYAPFVALIRANMRHFGALRIDHALGLYRQYWIPAGGDARGGGYVRYPVDDLIAILKLESRRNRCVVIGEDLGTVPPALVGKLRDAGILSYRLLYFERAADGGFAMPAAYPPLALVGIGTHDLPTLVGYWTGADIVLREAFGLFPNPAARQASLAERQHDREWLVAIFSEYGLLPSDFSADARLSPDRRDTLVDAAHAFIARTPSALMMAQAEDVLGVTEQVNLPGTLDQYPNWRRKLPADIAVLADAPRLRRLAAAITGTVDGRRHA